MIRINAYKKFSIVFLVGFVASAASLFAMELQITEKKYRPHTDPLLRITSSHLPGYIERKQVIDAILEGAEIGKLDRNKKTAYQRGLPYKGQTPTEEEISPADQEGINAIHALELNKKLEKEVAKQELAERIVIEKAKAEEMARQYEQDRRKRMEEQQVRQKQLDELRKIRSF